MTFPHQDQFLRTLAFIALLVVMGPCQIYVQVNYYASLSDAPDQKIVWAAIAGALFVLEASSISLLANALRAKALWRALFFGIVLPPLMFITFTADLGGFGQQLDGAIAKRAVARNLWSKANAELSDTEIEIKALADAIPETLRGKTVEALQAEREGIARSLAAYAAPPPGLLARDTRLATALATRRSYDKAVLRRDHLRETVAESPPQADLPQFAYLAAFLRLVGLKVTATDMKALLPVVLTLTAKFSMIAGFGVTGVMAAHQRAQVYSAAQQPGAPTQIAAPPPTPPVRTKAGKPMPGVAQIVRVGLNGLGRSSPPQP